MRGVAATALALLALLPPVAAEGGDAIPRSETTSTKTVAAPRPNVVLVLADDLGWGDLGCQGNTRFATPMMDRLAAEGTRFVDGYQAANTCTPSRAGLLTGRMPSELRLFSPIVSNGRNGLLGNAERLDPEVATVADLLGAAGYETIHVGKWHLKVNADARTPSEHGFTRARWVDLREGDRNLLAPSERPTNSATLVDAAIEEIDAARRASRPFYLQVWMSDPHTPVVPSEAQRQPFRGSDIPIGFTSPPEVYAAAVTELDRQIGRLVEAIDARGLGGDTLVLLSSDNGPETIRAGQDRWSAAGSAGPFRGGKRSLYEGGVRVPWIARWPGTVPAGRQDRTNVFSGLDLVPTLAALIEGVRVDDGIRSTWDGMDRSAVLRGDAGASAPGEAQPRIHRAKPLLWEWRYPIDAPVFWRSPMLAIRDGDWKFLMNPDGSREELFDLAKDPWEFRDVAALHPEVVARLRTLLGEWYEPMPKDGTRPEAGRLPPVP